MLFNSERFLVFFLVVFAVYWTLRGQRARVWWLVVASLFFYSTWNARLTLLVAASATMNYLVARGMSGTAGSGRRKLLFTAGLTGNLGLLAYFKYANFFLGSLQDGLAAAGVPISLPTLHILLPIGISFFTFEALNYTIDVYKRRIPAERSLIRILLFISFFPYVLAGPIVRAGPFLRQIARPKRFRWTRLQVGVELFLRGLFKKMVIADRMALFVDPVFSGPSAYSTGTLWVATIAYGMQIYCDFSGYSDMAIGIAHALGYKLPRNFNLPYLSKNIAEFWRRWHISLSSWLRDYLFIPLGGSRGTLLATCRNLLVTMAVCGLWHGASWTFVAWGTLHGVLLVTHRLFREVAARTGAIGRSLGSLPGTGLRIALTFLATQLAWVFFRADTFTSAATVLHGLFVPHAGEAPPMSLASFWFLLGVIAFGHAAVVPDLWRRIVARIPVPVVGIGYATILAITLLLAPDSGSAFIYFRF